VGVQRRGRAVSVHRRRPGKTILGLEEAHRELRITPEEFDEVAAELGRTLDAFDVPELERRVRSWPRPQPMRTR
jgi:hypothetical protein